jgi:xanthine dehydrogenase FAD-binding subunit
MFNVKSYQKVQTVQEAVTMLQANPQLVVVAGGTDVFIKMQHKWKNIEVDLMSIRDIEGLQKIEMRFDGNLCIGTTATFTQIHENELIQAKVPILAEAALSMGGPQIRNVATIGGNICNGMTSADSASSLFALDANLLIAGPAGEHMVPIEEFYKGPGRVNLEMGEILIGIIIDKKYLSGYGGRYIKYSMRKAMDIATLGVAVMVKLAEDGTYEDMRIGMGVAGPTPLLAHGAMQFAKGLKVTEENCKEIARKTLESSKARTSWRATKEFREHILETICLDALKEAEHKAGGECCE